MPSEAPIAGRTVVITGAGNGIGRALAHEAAARGAAHVAVIDIDPLAADGVARSLRGSGQDASAHVVDVTSSGQLEELATQIVAAHGTPGLVCANAGVGPASGPLLDTGAADVQWVLGVNTIGVLATLQAFGRLMATAGRPGWLMATASEHALGRPHLGLGVYTASKHAVLGMCDVLRGELPSHLGISVLCPGLTTSTLWNASSRRPDTYGGPAAGNPLGAAVLAKGMPAAEVARRAFDGLAAGEFLLVSHFSARQYALARWSEVDRAFARLAAIDTSSWHVEDVIASLGSEPSDPPTSPA